MKKRGLDGPNVQRGKQKNMINTQPIASKEKCD